MIIQQMKVLQYDEIFEFITIRAQKTKKPKILNKKQKKFKKIKNLMNFSREIIKEFKICINKNEIK